MMRTRFGKYLPLGAILAVLSCHAFAQEAVMEEVIVEAPFDLRLQLPKDSNVRIMIERLTLKADTERALELQIANRTPINTLLDLTKYSPIPLGGSDPRVDTFFLQNYMRADLNPSKRNPLFDDLRR
jgi:hypothetical protein